MNNINNTALTNHISPSKPKGISGSTLKIIACITILIEPHLPLETLGFSMLADPQYQGLFILDLILRSIGRIAFPIFCFLLIQGFLHTRNVKNMPCDWACLR